MRFRADSAEGSFGQGKAGNDAGLARGNNGIGRCVRCNCRIRCDVAGKTEVLIECGANRGFHEALGQGRQVILCAGHGLQAIADTLRVARGIGSIAFKSSNVMNVRFANAGSGAG
jgi:hypothetical protein